MRLPKLLLGLTVPVLAAATFVVVPVTPLVTSHVQEILVARATPIDDVNDLDDLDITAVRAETLALWNEGNIPTSEDVERALRNAFGDASYDGTTTEYVWVINPETGEWEKVCLATSTFTVFGRTDPNPIVVTLYDEFYLALQ